MTFILNRPFYLVVVLIIVLTTWWLPAKQNSALSRSRLEWSWPAYPGNSLEADVLSASGTALFADA
jgi:hypothetical protein